MNGRTSDRDTAPHRSRDPKSLSRGQGLVLFAMAIVMLMGLMAIVIDVSWYWSNSLRVQRAADAAAMAGAVWLPGNAPKGVTMAAEEATKNGYTASGGTQCGVDKVCIEAAQDIAHANPNRMVVTITAPVQTFFMRILGINSIRASRTAKAEYVLPVPMGSPQNYYGVGLFVVPSANTGLDAGTPVAGGAWSNPSRADGDNNGSYATASANGAQQQWGTFGLLDPPTIPNATDIGGIEVQIRAYRTGTGTPYTGCQVQAQLSWDGGANWSPSSPNADTTYTLTSTETAYTFGSPSNLDTWSGHTWTRDDFSDSNFRVRLTFAKPSCATTRTVSLDTLQVRVSTPSGTQPIAAPDGTTLSPQYFWGAMQSQGAPNVQGDAFMTQYASRSPTLKTNGVDANQDPDAYYDPNGYYNYGIDIPAGVNDGEVWVFDPGFCEVSTSYATGENWTVGSPNGYSTVQPVSAFFDLFDTKQTPYDLTDDDLTATSGTTFRRLTGEDSTLGGSHGSTDCTAEGWHDGWWRLASGLSGGAKGTTYRLHTYSTDPNSPSDQANTTALNGFAIWAHSSSSTPAKVYGIGAMEGYFRLPGNQVSEFFMAQIDKVHAGKTMVIDLWDPGDTGSLTAKLEILQPTAGGWTPFTNFKYYASTGSTDPNAVSCSTTTRTASSITTASGGTSYFNGCWIRILVVLPPDYSAPTPAAAYWPAGIPASSYDGGWWRIRYTMTGSGNSTDLTSWKVSIRGNPVHLVVP
jgi:hypothetical protein